jgi:hypothetical protein
MPTIALASMMPPDIMIAPPLFLFKHFCVSDRAVAG